MLNQFLCALGGALLLVVCVSFSLNGSFVHNTAVMAPNVQYQSNGIEISVCTYLGMRGFCQAVCGPSTALFPKDSPARTCSPSPVIRYSSIISQPTCLANGVATDAELLLCTAVSVCRGGGYVSLCFSIIGTTLAFTALYFVAKRTVNDSYFAKKYAIIFSVLTITCGVVTYAAFRPCSQDFENWLQYQMGQNIVPSFITPNAYTAVANNKPASGGIMVLISLCIFAYLGIANYCVPVNQSRADAMDVKLMLG